MRTDTLRENLACLNPGEKLKSITANCPQSPPEGQDTEGDMWIMEKGSYDTLIQRGGLVPPDQLSSSGSS